MHILVELNGVLKNTADDQLIPPGVLMVGTLTVYNQITFMTPESKASAEMWLNQNKIVDFDDIIDAKVGLTSELLEERQIKYARARGAVDLFITGNPHLWAFAFDLGIPSVMLGVPSYTRPEFRPDAPKKLRAWDEIERAVREQNEQRTKDARLSRTEALNFE